MGTAYRNPGLLVSMEAESIIADGIAVVVGAADMKCALPAGADPVGGVLGLVKIEGGTSCAVGDTVDIVTSGVYAGVAAAGITRGDKVAINGATGTLKTAAPGAGVNNMVVGTALSSASAGDRFPVLINPHVMQGA